MESIMRKFFGCVIVLLLIVAAVGYYRGWFDVSTGSQDQKSNISISMDKEKLRQDADKAAKSLENLADKVKGKAEPEKAKDKSHQP
jgi:hypothetical protein